MHNHIFIRQEWHAQKEKGKKKGERVWLLDLSCAYFAVIFLISSVSEIAIPSIISSSLNKAM